MQLRSEGCVGVPARTVGANALHVRLDPSLCDIFRVFKFGTQLTLGHVEPHVLLLDALVQAGQRSCLRVHVPIDGAVGRRDLLLQQVRDVGDELIERCRQRRICLRHVHVVLVQQPRARSLHRRTHSLGALVEREQLRHAPCRLRSEVGPQRRQPCALVRIVAVRRRLVGRHPVTQRLGAQLVLPFNGIPPRAESRGEGLHSRFSLRLLRGMLLLVGSVDIGDVGSQLASQKGQVLLPLRLDGGDGLLQLLRHFGGFRLHVGHVRLHLGLVGLVHLLHFGDGGVDVRQDFRLLRLLLPSDGVLGQRESVFEPCGVALHLNDLVKHGEVEHVQVRF